METKARIKLQYPLPVAKLYEAMQLETEARQRVRKLVDLFERTAQYLVLVGLASYQQQGLSDPKVEDLRSELARPSLGHWVELLKALSKTLRPDDPAFLTPDPTYNYKDEAIGAAASLLKEMLGLGSLKKVMLHQIPGFKVFSLYISSIKRLISGRQLIRTLGGTVPKPRLVYNAISPT